MAKICRINIQTRPLENRSWLPDITQLDHFQNRVVMHPNNSELFVMGPAGTGKTVLAKMKYNQLKAMGLNGKLVIYGNLFKSFIQSQINELVEDIVGSFQLPRILANIGFNGNFDETARRAAEWSIHHRNIYDFLIIDEVQDLHKNHLIFCSNIARRIYLFGDNAQQFYSHGCTIEQIISLLNENDRNFLGANVIEITRNYRNQPSVASAAQPFYSFAPALFPSADLEGGQENSELYLFVNNNFFPILANKIRELSNLQVGVSPTIGLLVQSNIVMNRIKNGLSRQGINVTEYQNQYSFNDAKPVLLTMQSSKGMEFDYIILIDLDYYNLQRTHLTYESKEIGICFFTQ
jgi:superfamily I DNA/RNA helicase